MRNEEELMTWDFVNRQLDAGDGNPANTWVGFFSALSQASPRFSMVSNVRTFPIPSNFIALGVSER